MVFRLNHVPQAEMGRIFRVYARPHQLLLFDRVADPAQSEKDHRCNKEHPNDASH